MGEIKFQNVKYHSGKRNLIPSRKASEPEIRGKTQPAPGDEELLLMDGKDRAKPDLVRAMWGGGGHRGGHWNVPGLIVSPLGTPLWSKETSMKPLRREESSKTSPKQTHPHPCPHAGGMTREREALAAPGKHRLLSTFIRHQPASPFPSSSSSPSSPAPPTATVAGRGLRAGAMLRAPHTHAPKRSLKRSNMD